MATWTPAAPGTIIGDGQGNYQMKVAGQWTPMPKGSLAADANGAYHFDSDAIKPPTTVKPTEPDSGGEGASDNAAPAPGEAAAQGAGGLSDILSTVLANVPHALAHAVSDIASGGEGSPSPAPHQLGPAGQHLVEY